MEEQTVEVDPTTVEEVTVSQEKTEDTVEIPATGSIAPATTYRSGTVSKKTTRSFAAWLQNETSK